MKVIAALALAIALALSAIGAPAALSAPITAESQLGLHVESVSHLGGSSLAIAARDSYAFVGSSAEFVVVDVQDVQHPRRVVYLPQRAACSSITSPIHCADGYAGLSIIELAN